MNTTAKSALAASAMLAITALMSAQASATEDKVYITGVRFAGSGCNEATDTLSLPPVDFPTQFSVLYSGNYTAQSGPGTMPADWRKNCNIVVYFHLPNGYQFSIFDVRFSGFAQLAYGVKATNESTYQFLFAPPPWAGKAKLSKTFVGRFEDDYSFAARVLDFDSFVWSPCGDQATLNIRTQVFLSGIGGRSLYVYPGLITSDENDGQVTQVYGMVWRPCEPY
jgi:hypothetical protein